MNCHAANGEVGHYHKGACAGRECEVRSGFAVADAMPARIVDGHYGSSTLMHEVVLCPDYLVGANFPIGYRNITPIMRFM